MVILLAGLFAVQGSAPEDRTRPGSETRAAGKKQPHGSLLSPQLEEDEDEEEDPWMTLDEDETSEFLLPTGAMRSVLAARLPGAVMVVGGGEITDPVRDRFMELAGGKKARVVVIPTASEDIDPDDPDTSYGFWRRQAVESATLLHTRSPREANDPAFIKPLLTATGVWIGGGDQSRLTEAYLGTAVLKAIRGVLERGGVVAGTSAGASIMSAVMITGGEKKAELGMGFGLLPSLVVDQHFTQRNRLGRLVGAIDREPELIGVGLDESTAAVIKGSEMSVVGEGTVYVCESLPQQSPTDVQQLKTGDRINLLAQMKKIARGRASLKGMMTKATRGR
jgi:cyanophycinase